VRKHSDTSGESGPGDWSHAQSLEHAHRMIAKLGDHIQHLHKMIAAHNVRHAQHERTALDHGERIAKLERAAPRSDGPPVYKLSPQQQRAMAKKFIENFQS